MLAGGAGGSFLGASLGGNWGAIIGGVAGLLLGYEKAKPAISQSIASGARPDYPS